MELGEERLVGQLLSGGFGDTEVDDFGHRHAVVDGDQDVRGLEVAMDDALLMRVLDGLTNLHEQVESLPCGKILLVAVVGDPKSPNEFHYEVGSAGLRGAAVENLRDVRMVHQSQRLPLVGSGYSASPVAADGKIYLSNEDGEMLVIAAGATFAHLATNSMGEPLMATPVLSQGVMYVRGSRTLFAVGKK